jgi:predicted metal-binding protein
MNDQSEFETLFNQSGFTDFKWIDPRHIIVSEWVRMKCAYGCKSFGKNATCPPNLPPVVECRRFFEEYQVGVIFHFEKTVEKPEDRHAWSRKTNLELLKLERAVFLTGYQKAFLLFMDSCSLCAECTGRKEDCKNPQSARPSPEAMALDVFSTVRGYGFPIEVLPDYTQAMNRFAFLLVE